MEYQIDTVHVAKLTRDEFTRSLRQGRGAALQHALVYGLNDVEDLVIKACLEEQAFDAQCEGNRASWLYRMFKDAPEYERFQARIVAEFDSMAEDSSAEQLCELAGRMARDGDEKAGQALRSFVWSQDFSGGESVFGCHAVVSLDGLAAAIEIARRYGRILLGGSDAFLDTLDALTDSTEAYALIHAELKLLARTDPAIAAYVEREQQEIDRRLASDREGQEEKLVRKERYRAEVMAQLSVAQIIAAAERKDPNRGQFIRFGRWANEAQLNRALERLSVEADPEVCLRLLWIFGNTTPAYVCERMLTLALDHSLQIRDAAMTALGNAEDSSVGEFGRKFLRSGNYSAADAAVFELFTKHYKTGDESLIMQALSSLNPSDEDAHDIGMSLRGFCRRNNSPAIAPIVNWLHRTNPCTICRHEAVELLIEADCLDASLAFECQYDAKSATQELVK